MYRATELGTNPKLRVSDVLHYNKDGTMDVYGRSTLPGQTRYQTRYSRNLHINSVR